MQGFENHMWFAFRELCTTMPCVLLLADQAGGIGAVPDASEKSQITKEDTKKLLDL